MRNRSRIDIVSVLAVLFAIFILIPYYHYVFTLFEVMFTSPVGLAMVIFLVGGVIWHFLQSLLNPYHPPIQEEQAKQDFKEKPEVLKINETKEQPKTDAYYEWLQSKYDGSKAKELYQQHVKALHSKKT